MILPPHYRNKKIGVLGLGLSGRATVASLQASGAEVFAWDDGEEAREACAVIASNASYQTFQKWPWKEMEAVIISPGIPLYYPQPHPVATIANATGCPIMGDIDLLMEAQPQAHYVGITGTNGKSTTTALTGHLLKSLGAIVAVGGNIGTAALDLPALGKDGIYVLEMSSYQLDLMVHGQFNVAALLNISPDHLDRHGGMEGYIAAKERIFSGMDGANTAIIGVDDAFTQSIYDGIKTGRAVHGWQKQGAPKLVPISLHKSLKNGWLEQADELLCIDDAITYDISEVAHLQGRHNRQNALAAVAICAAFGYTGAAVQKGLESFAGLEHRMQLIGQYRRVSYVNDSKATNANAAQYALATYDRIFWIAGGVPKEGGIDSLAEYFPKIESAYLIGEAAAAFAQRLSEHGVAFERCDSLEQATSAAHRDATAYVNQRETGDDDGSTPTVLLSPACASFDQFRNFEHRGEVFARQVRDLLSSTGGHDASNLDSAADLADSEDDIFIIPQSSF